MQGIVLGIFSSLLNVVNTDVYRRAISVALSYRAGALFRTFFMNALSLGLVALLVLVLAFVPGESANFSPLSDPFLLAVVFSVSASGMASAVIGQYAYANERIGTLAPYGETGRILTILGGFALFSGTSFLSFACALLAGLAIMAASVDFRNFSVNRYCAALAASGILRAYSALCAGWIVLRLDAVPFVAADLAAATVVTFGLVWREGFPKGLPGAAFAHMGKWFLANDAIWFVSYLISLFLLKDLGVVVTSLLGMVAMVATVAYGRFVLGERPESKTWALAAFVATCVVVGSAA